MTTKLRWGILSTGLIAKELADGINASSTGELLAVGSRSQSSADEFAKAYRVPRAYGSYEALLADPDVQCVYVATPHPMHAEWTIKAAEGGKHILVEKPIGMNAFEAMAMIDAAREHDVFLMEAFMYRCHPQMTKLREMVRSKAVGEVRMIRAVFTYDATGAGLEHRAFNKALGGGGILDVGCYPASISRMIAGEAIGKTFDDPTEVKGCGHLGPGGADYWAVASLKFASGIIAELTTGVGLNHGVGNTVTVFGSVGRIDVPDPWCPSRWNLNPAKIFVQMYDQKQPTEVPVESTRELYTLEADMVADHIAQRQAPAMTWDDTVGNMRLLDRWRSEVGLVYDIEQAEHSTGTFANRPLRRRDKHNMRYGRIAGLDKPVSRLVLGCDSNHAFADTAMLMDDFFERGGNAFDTSHGYGNPNGASEINIGAWVRSRGVRDRVVIQEKGGNPPYVTPQGVDYELRHGLERLQMDRVDIYTIHRDNEQVPIGEWVDLLNQHLRAGRMTIFGLSNFSVPRLEAFAAYAKQHGLASFSLVSNQFSLAQVQADLWPGYTTVSSSDDASRAWFVKTKTPMLPWSSQARGFFTDRAGRDKPGDAELRRCWYSEENFRRRDRAFELAAKRGVEPINIALAYVLAQPFPTFTLVGPKRPAEIRSSCNALDIELTAAEVKWLEQGV